MNHYPIAIDYTPGTTYEVTVQYNWMNSPEPDFTLKVYSKHDTPIHAGALGGPTNMLFTDGVSEPSEFSGNGWTVDDMVPEDVVPEGLHDVTDHDHACEEIDEIDFTNVQQYIAVAGHALEEFNGNYEFAGLVNNRPHFEQADGAGHIYYY